MITRDELLHLDATVGTRHGWDFARVRDARDPVPWDYLDVVRRYLFPGSRVLDVGTGGGERFMALAADYGYGVGVDIAPQMIRDAATIRRASGSERPAFAVMAAESLGFAAASFDLVLNRHSDVQVPEVVRVLRPGGVFITQQVGARNTANICQALGCGPGGQYAAEPDQDGAALAAQFSQAGCTVVARAEYDVPYCFCDVESFVFWLKAIPMPEDFAMARHWEQVARLITTDSTPRGIMTNEHRELLIIRKQA